MADKVTRLAELPIPAKHRYDAGPKITSAWLYNVAQLCAMFGESAATARRSSCFDGAMRRHCLVDGQR
ncbi:MAG: hypothetical protein JOZ11_10380 [Alphaproteobacteria bacterium]|nr:hypothetical protein [Alphaproteobacteria bacterium]